MQSTRRELVSTHTASSDTRSPPFLKILGAAVSTLLVLLPVRWQPGVTATNDPKTVTVVDASGNFAGARTLSHRLPVFGYPGAIL